MWIFDIADGHTLEIYVFPMSSSDEKANFIGDIPTYVKDDLTFQVFQHESYDRRYLTNSFGLITSIQRGTKYNAISLHPMYEEDLRESNMLIVFAVPRLHVENIPALIANTPEPWTQNSGKMKPKVVFLAQGDYDFVLDEITPCGLSAAHEMTTTMWSQELCPPIHFHNVYVAPQNLLRIAIYNHSKEHMEFEVQPEFNNTYEYDKTRIYVPSGEKKIIHPFSADDVFQGFKVKRLHEDIHERVTNVFRLYDQPPQDNMRTANTPQLPVSHSLVEPPLVEPPLVEPPLVEPPLVEPPLVAPPLVAPHLVAPPAVNNASMSSVQNMVQNLQITKQNLQTLQYNQKAILDKLLKSNKITVVEFDVLSMGFQLLSTCEIACNE